MTGVLLAITLSQVLNFTESEKLAAKTFLNLVGLEPPPLSQVTQGATPDLKTFQFGNVGCQIGVNSLRGRHLYYHGDRVLRAQTIADPKTYVKELLRALGVPRKWLAGPSEVREKPDGRMTLYVQEAQDKQYPTFGARNAALISVEFPSATVREFHFTENIKLGRPSFGLSRSTALLIALARHELRLAQSAPVSVQAGTAVDRDEFMERHDTEVEARSAFRVVMRPADKKTGDVGYCVDASTGRFLQVEEEPGAHPDRRTEKDFKGDDSGARSQAIAFLNATRLGFEVTTDSLGKSHIASENAVMFEGQFGLITCELSSGKVCQYLNSSFWKRKQVVEGEPSQSVATVSRLAKYAGHPEWTALSRSPSGGDISVTKLHSIGKVEPLVVGINNGIDVITDKETGALLYYAAVDNVRAVEEPVRLELEAAIRIVKTAIEQGTIKNIHKSMADSLVAKVAYRVDGSDFARKWPSEIVWARPTYAFVLKVDGEAIQAPERSRILVDAISGRLILD